MYCTAYINMIIFLVFIVIRKRYKEAMFLDEVSYTIYIFFFDIQKIVSESINNNFNPADIGKFKNVRDVVKIASVESINGESYIEQTTDINYIITPDLNVTQNVTQYTESWKNNMTGGKTDEL